MRTIYTVHNHDVEEGCGYGDWDGDCPRWAAEARRLGRRVTATRVLWVGKTWSCAACYYGHH